jgi:hypothetical protein
MTDREVHGGCAIFPRRTPDESPIFVHGDGVEPCSCCAVIAEFACDFPLGKGKTCDAPLCVDHAILQGRSPANQPRLFVDEIDETDPDEMVHFCPVHHLMAKGNNP